MPYEEFRRRIDTARQILVGAVPSPAGQIDQITYALMYKFLNDRDDQAVALGGQRSYFIGEYAKYNWHELMSPMLGAHERLELYQQTIQTMAKNEHLPELFRSIYQNAFLPFNSPNVLSMFLKEIDRFSHGESDDIGDAYEYLLSITGAQGDVGQFRTPRHIIKFIVEAVNPAKDDKVLDPAVGTAGFMIAAYNHVKAQHDGKDAEGHPNDEHRLTADDKKKLFKNYRGFDIDPTMVRTAKVNLYLHGFPTPDIINHDSLSSEDYWDDRYDVIFANPPFMSPKGGIQPHKKFSIAASRAEVLFVDYIASHLKPNGRAGIIVPEGIIFQNGKVYRELRKNLIENHLYAVISLPAGVFNPYAGVKTSVLLLDKELTKKRDDVLFIKIDNDGYSLGTQRRPINGNQLPEALQLVEDFKQGKEVSAQLAHTVNKDLLISSSDYSLNGDKYKAPLVTAATHWPLVTLDEIINLKFGTRITKKDHEGTKYPVYGGGGESFSTDEFNRQDEYVISRFAMSENCIRLVRGKFFMLDSGFTFDPKDERVLKDYVGKILLNIQATVYACGRGHAQKNIDIKQFKDIRIPLPPIEIQRHIVEELNGYLQIIEAAQTIVKTYKATIDLNPEWPKKEIGHIAEIDNGNAFKSSEYVDSGARVIRITNVQKGEIVDAQPKYLDVSRIKEFARYELFEDDLLMSLTGNVGRVGLYPASMVPGLLNQRVARIRPTKSIVDKTYLFYILNQPAFEHDALKAASGVAQKNLSTEWLKAYEIPLPALEVQHQIVSELEVEREIVNANKRLMEIFQQKIKTMLTELWKE